MRYLNFNLIPLITLYIRNLLAKNTFEVIKVTDKDKKNIVDKNLFNAMNYEFAGDIGVIDNEDMIKNKKIPTNSDKQKGDINSKK